MRDQARRANDARVRCEHAVDIGPDLDLARADTAPDDRDPNSRTPASERRRMTIDR
jgi:hypothetical protein